MTEGQERLRSKQARERLYSALTAIAESLNLEPIVPNKNKLPRNVYDQYQSLFMVEDLASLAEAIQQALYPSQELEAVVTEDPEEPEEDLLATFLSSNVVSSPGSFLPSSDLYLAYSAYCTEQGESPEPLTPFGRKLSQLGWKSSVKRKGISTVRGFPDVALAVTTVTDE
jgi:hypothetical protein